MTRIVKQKLRNENLLSLNPTDIKEENIPVINENLKKYSLPELTKVFKL